MMDKNKFGVKYLYALAGSIVGSAPYLLAYLVYVFITYLISTRLLAGPHMLWYVDSGYNFPWGALESVILFGGVKFFALSMVSYVLLMIYAPLEVMEPEENIAQNGYHGANMGETMLGEASIIFGSLLVLLTSLYFAWNVNRLGEPYLYVVWQEGSAFMMAGLATGYMLVATVRLGRYKIYNRPWAATASAMVLIIFALSVTVFQGTYFSYASKPNLWPLRQYDMMNFLFMMLIIILMESEKMRKM